MVILFLCALYVVAAERALLDEEQQVFQEIWGISDFALLRSLEEDPKQFWLDRDNELLQGSKKVMRHDEFCQQYVKDAKIYMAQQLQEVDALPWFADPELIGRILKEYMREDHPGFAHVQSTFYAVACDLCRTKDQIEACEKKAEESCSILKEQRDMGKRLLSRLSSEKAFRAHLRYLQASGFASIILKISDKLRWRVLPNSGRFPMIDSLILRRKGLHLCSVSSNFEERSNTFLHSGQFEGWLGALRHDVYGHAGAIERLSEKTAQEYDVSYQDYFHACCNPDALEKGDLFSMSRQVQAWFMHFHEVPSAMFCYLSKLPDILFPQSPKLPDFGFMNITPYFLQPPKYGWRNEPLIKIETTEDAVNNQLRLWYIQYDALQVGDFLTNPVDTMTYLLRLHANRERFPDFFKNLRKSEQSERLACGNKSA